MTKTPMKANASDSQSSDELQALLAEIKATDAKPKKIGNFAMFDTRHGGLLRINLEKIRTYAKSGENNIQISYDNGTGTVLQYSSPADADIALTRLDEYCL